MVGRQPLLWVIPLSDVRNSCDAIAAALGLEGAAARELVAKMPPLLALEPQWLRLAWVSWCHGAGGVSWCCGRGRGGRRHSVRWKGGGLGGGLP